MKQKVIETKKKANLKRNTQQLYKTIEYHEVEKGCIEEISYPDC